MSTTSPEGGLPVDQDEEAGPNESTQQTISNLGIPAPKTFEEGVQRLLRLHDQLGRVLRRDSRDASDEALRRIEDAQGVLEAHLRALPEPPASLPLESLGISWEGRRLSAHDLLVEWGTAGPIAFAGATLEERVRVLRERDGELLTIRVRRAADSKCAWWRVAGSHRSAAAYREAQRELDRQDNRAAKIASEIAQWLPVVANDPGLVLQNNEGLLSTKDAIAELERWVWTQRQERWTVRKRFHRNVNGLRRLDLDLIQYDDTTTISPRSFVVLNQLKEYLGAVPNSVGEVPVTIALEPGFGHYITYTGNWAKATTTDTVIVRCAVGALTFRWLIELTRPWSATDGGVSEAPEVVIVLSGGSVRRVVSNLPSLHARVVDFDSPQYESDERVSIPGDKRSAYLWRLTPESNDELLEVVRARAPIRSR